MVFRVHRLAQCHHPVAWTCPQAVEVWAHRPWAWDTGLQDLQFLAWDSPPIAWHLPHREEWDSPPTAWRHPHMEEWDSPPAAWRHPPREEWDSPKDLLWEELDHPLPVWVHPQEWGAHPKGVWRHLRWEGLVGSPPCLQASTLPAWAARDRTLRAHLSQGSRRAAWGHLAQPTSIFQDL